MVFLLTGLICANFASRRGLKITRPVTFGCFIAIIEPFRQRGRVAQACVA